MELAGPHIIRDISFEEPVDEGTQAIVDELQKSRSVFIKPTSGYCVHDSERIMRLRLVSDELHIECSSESFLNRVKGVVEKMGVENKLGQDCSLSVPVNNPRLLPRVIKHIVQPFYRDFVCEDEIRIPRIRGLPWEIRHVLQDMGEGPVIVGHHGKVGGINVSAGISIGGRSIRATELLMEILSTRIPNLKRKGVLEAMGDFFQKSNPQAVLAFEAVNEYMVPEFLKFIRGFPEEHLRLPQMAVDITGEFHGNQLIPTVIEINPTFAEKYFSKADPEGYSRFRHNEDMLARKGYKILKHYVGETTTSV